MPLVFPYLQMQHITQYKFVLLNKNFREEKFLDLLFLQDVMMKNKTRRLITEYIYILPNVGSCAIMPLCDF